MTRTNVGAVGATGTTTGRLAMRTAGPPLRPIPADPGTTALYALALPTQAGHLAWPAGIRRLAAATTCTAPMGPVGRLPASPSPAAVVSAAPTNPVTPSPQEPATDTAMTTGTAIVTGTGSATVGSGGFATP